MHLDPRTLRAIAIGLVLLLLYGSRLTKGSVVQTAEGLAFRIMRETKPGNFRDRLNYAYAITLGREASAREAERMGKYFDDTSRGLAASPQTVAALFPNQLEGVPQSDAAAWVADTFLTALRGTGSQ